MLRDNGYLRALRDFRISWIGGRTGGYKSALSVKVASMWLDRGWAKYAVGNFPSVVFTDWARIPEVRDLFIVLDEGGNWLVDKQFDQVTAFLRKRNITLMIPSVMPANLRARTLNVQMVVDLHPLGFDFVYYICKLDYMQVKERYWIQWWRPSEMFGTYDTEYPSMGSDGIIEWVVQAFEEEQKALRAGREDIPGNVWARRKVLTDGNTITGTASKPHQLADARTGSKNASGSPGEDRPVVASRDGVGDVEALRGVIREYSSAADKISDALPVLERVAKKIRR